MGSFVMLRLWPKMTDFTHEDSSFLSLASAPTESESHLIDWVYPFYWAYELENGVKSKNVSLNTAVYK